MHTTVYLASAFQLKNIHCIGGFTCRMRSLTSSHRNPFMNDCIVPKPIKIKLTATLARRPAEIRPRQAQPSDARPAVGAGPTSQQCHARLMRTSRRAGDDDVTPGT